MDCPDANQLQALVEGRLTALERDAIHEHADSCQACRKSIVALARGRPPPAAQADDSGYAPTLIGPRAAPPPSLMIEAMPEPGTEVGRYRVESFLGAGGLGIVCVAFDPELGRRIALKLVRRSVAGDRAAAQARMVREAQAMARVSHPNVLAVLDVGTWNDRVFIAMELVDGVDLRRWLSAQPRSIKTIVDVFRAAGQGLAAAHDVGIVHRDFKPENVLVAKDGRVRVADFGLAREAGDEELAKLTSTSDRRDLLVTAPGAIVGTPAYMAPEQYAGGNVDGRSDQFAFCAALYEALFGERAFAGEDFASLRRAVLKGEMRAPPRASRVPAALRQIIVRGLATQPGERWPNMSALLDALSRDRTRGARRVLVAALAALAVIATAAAGDWVVRTRLHSVARASFAATGEGVDRNLVAQYEALDMLARLSMQIPIIREVAGTRDQSDFGLGSIEDDRRALEQLHASLRDADWSAWSLPTRKGTIGIADYKGRLLYSSGNVESYGGEVLALRAAADAFRGGGPGRGAQVIRADAPELTASGFSSAPRSGLLVMFARAAVLGGAPRALFLQTIEGRRFLEQAGARPEDAIALVAPDGSVDGELHSALVAAALASPEALVEAQLFGRQWLVQSHQVPNIELGGAPIATVVVGREVLVGLTGLFPRARAVLFAAALLALGALAYAGLHIARNSTR